jgi:hypothetical protein
VVRGARGSGGWRAGRAGVAGGARGAREWPVARGSMACNAAVGNVALFGGNNTAMLKDTRI